MTTARPAPIRVEIWADPQCVWCFIAHPRFEKAVAALTRRLFTAYFTEGRHIGRADELLELAHDVGIDRETARAVLTERHNKEAVEQDDARLRALGARGVPLYVIDGQWGISGAQPVQTYLDALERAAAG